MALPIAPLSLLAGLLAASPVTSLTPKEQAVWAQAQAVTPAGAALAQLIDSLDVEHRWQNDVHVAWFSGLPNNADATNGVATHCSAFVSAVCERLGVYILRPPEHSQVLLANQQAVWVNGTGAGQGWTSVPDPVTAQAFANRGQLVLYLRKNSDPSKPGHTAVVRPFAQTSRDTVLQRGPRLAQASTVNSASTDTYLSRKRNHFYAVLQRPAPGPRLRSVWTPPRDPATSYLLDAAPGGRLDAIKVFYDSSGAPTWHTAAGGLPAAASGAPNSAATLNTQWHRLVLSASAKQEPYLTKEEAGVRFQLSAAGARLAVAEGGGGAQALQPAGTLALGPANGLWYAAVDDVYYGLFVTASRAAAPAYLSGYLLGWRRGDGEPRHQTLVATWPARGAPTWSARPASVALLRNCAPARGGRLACVNDASAKRLKVAMGASGTALTLEGLPGTTAPLLLLKAGTATPVLNAPAVA